MMKPAGSTAKALERGLVGILIGVIDAIMVVPVTISFAAIIFRHDVFTAYLPSLIKLTLFSSAIHQIAFTWNSGLNFAVGQVQDAGLIFLSSMAGNIADTLLDEDQHESIVPTTLFVLSIYTALMGLVLVLIGRLHLASVIQYLPMPVVGGYLAFIGFYCGQAGLSMMSGTDLQSIRDWPKLADFHATLLLLPGLMYGVLMYVLLRNVRSPFTLPCSMVGMLVAFHSLLWLTSTSLQDARDHGWVYPLTPQVPFYQAWTLYRAQDVQWSQLLPQFPRFVGMLLVVAFSSSLDVAAIEMEVGLPLNYDRELQTVGISNLLSGCLGGYTGSYIFSQTIFTLRRGVTDDVRVCGWTVAVLELAVVVAPVSVTSYLPKMFFGSMLVLIAMDLMW